MECGEYFAIPAATIRTFTPIRDAFRTSGIIRAVNAFLFALDQGDFGMHSVGLATSAATSAAYIPDEGKDKMVVTNHAMLATRYAAHVTHTASFWSAVAFDMARAEEGATASVIAGLPLWPQDQAELLESLWQEMKAALLTANQDWQVWTSWYEDRLAGRVQDEEHELVYALILSGHYFPHRYRRDPAEVNANIKRRIEGLAAGTPAN